MMNVADIAERIAHPEHIRKSDLQALKELTDKYPYSQVFPILYLKGLSSCADILFEEELQKLSYRVSDRVQLYTIIHDHTEQDESVVVTEQKDTSGEEVTRDTEQPLKIIEDSSTQEEASEKEELPVIREVPEEETDEVIAEEIHEPVESEQDILTEPEGNSVESSEQSPDKLEETILHHAIAANYRLEDLTPEEEAALEAREKEIETEETEEVQKEEKTRQSAFSFTDWLHADANYTEQDNSEKEAINAVVESFAEFDPTHDLFGEVSKPKAEFFSPVKKAKESLDENKLPVSETLAKIYTMQGNYPKAIAAYKELSLAFPEKKIFFANLIKDLEKKLNK